MSAKHTPGEWKVANGHAFVYALNTSGANRFSLGITPGWDGKGERTSPEECEANARLIAAAPELLEALIAVRDKRHSEDVWEIVNAAIAKATGAQQ